jgi:hypothetical protein
MGQKCYGGKWLWNRQKSSATKVLWDKNAIGQKGYGTKVLLTVLPTPAAMQTFREFILAKFPKQFKTGS